ncbi:hypothetical protein LY44_02969 [Rhodobacter capsulatus]|nr:hypothetical protein LY44_02969 [Rhodobacter capsulatus]
MFLWARSEAAHRNSSMCKLPTSRRLDSTVRYLGVDLEDALTLSEGIDL